MCNSYLDGMCLYYGVEVREMNYKCERGVCMETFKCECGNDKFWDSTSKYMACPECGKVYNKQTYEKVRAFSMPSLGTTVKFESVNGVKICR